SAREAAGARRRARHRQAVRLQAARPGAADSVMTPVPRRSPVQTKIFMASLVTSAIALTVAGALFGTAVHRQLDEQIEQTLAAEARLAAKLLAGGTASSV